MRIHFTMGTRNLTPYIVSDTYNINSVDSSESWNDGNMIEHRVIITNKVEGSFEIVCSNRANSITLSDFMALWNANVDNGVAQVGLYVINKDEFKAVSCYYTITSKSHIISADGSCIDVLTITIKER